MQRSATPPAIPWGSQNPHLRLTKLLGNRPLRPQLAPTALSAVSLTEAPSECLGYSAHLGSRGLVSSAPVACVWSLPFSVRSPRSILLSPKLCSCSLPASCRSSCSFFSSSLSVTAPPNPKESEPVLNRHASLHSPLFFQIHKLHAQRTRPQIHHPHRNPQIESPRPPPPRLPLHHSSP